MIEKDKDAVKVSFQRIASATLMTPGGPIEAELVPYVNGISGQRDPMIRPIKNKARFLHMTTIQKYYPRSAFKDEDGVPFGIDDVMGMLYN